MKSMVVKIARASLAVIVGTVIAATALITTKAAEKSAESAQANCSCNKLLIYESLRYSEKIDVSRHRSWYYQEYECQHGVTAQEVAKIESHNMYRTKDLGHAGDFIQHCYEYTCSRCSYSYEGHELCYCNRFP